MILVNNTCHVALCACVWCGVCFLIFHTVRDGINRLTAIEAVVSGMHVVLCETEGGKKNPVCMLLPGRAPQRFECVTAHACVYFGKITMGGCVFTLHGKIILLTAWKINGMSLSLPASAVHRGRPHLPHGGALTQPPVSLTLAPVLTWLSPLFHLSFLHYYLSCPLVLLFSLLCWQRLNVTPSAVACCCVRLYEMKCFISAAPGMDFGLAWLGCTDPNDRPTLAY